MKTRCTVHCTTSCTKYSIVSMAQPAESRINRNIFFVCAQPHIYLKSTTSSLGENNLDDGLWLDLCKFTGMLPVDEQENRGLKSGPWLSVFIGMVKHFLKPQEKEINREEGLERFLLSFLLPVKREGTKQDHKAAERLQRSMGKLG